MSEISKMGVLTFFKRFDCNLVVVILNDDDWEDTTCFLRKACEMI